MSGQWAPPGKGCSLGLQGTVIHYCILAISPLALKGRGVHITFFLFVHYSCQLSLDVSLFSIENFDLFEFLPYVHGTQRRSCQDGQLC